MSNILSLNNVSKHYDNFQLDNINLNLEPGYIMGFIGPNGAGKSTTIKLIMNLIKANEGHIEIFGKDHIKHEKEIKDRIGFVYDDNHFYETLSIKENKSIIAPFYSKWDEKAFNTYLRDFNLDPKKKIKDLSKGMKMKFSLAIALSHHAELIIMDEPTSGLDPVFRSEILDILGDVIQDEQKSIFFSTHITTDLDKIADYITFLNDGKIVFSDVKEDILNSYHLVKGGMNELSADKKSSLIGCRTNAFGFEGLTKSPDAFRGSQFMLEKPSLEDIMVYTVRGNTHA